MTLYNQRVGRLVLVLIAASGCDWLFQLDKIPPPPDAFSCTTIERPSGTCRTLAATVAGDAFLSMVAPDTALGKVDALHISDVDPALIKFDLGVLGAGEVLAGVRIVLTPTTRAKACSSDGLTCAPCANTLTAWTLQWGVTGWNQQIATFNTYNVDAQTGQNIPWHQPGASAIPDDRSELVAVGSALPGQPLSTTATREDLARVAPECYALPRAVAVIQGSGEGWFGANELEGCDATTQRPAVELTGCR